MKHNQFADKAGYYLQVRGGRNLGEGPWNTPNDALEFFDSEVGVACRVVRFVEQTGAILPQSKWLKPFTSK